MSATDEKPLRVAVDAGALAFERRTGIGRYLESVLPRIVELAGDRARFVLLAGRPLCNPVALRLVESGAVEAATARWPSLHAWQQLVMGRRIRQARADVHFAPDGLLPLGYSGPSVGVIHDMLCRRHPGTVGPHIWAVYAARQKASLRRLSVALADSEATKRELTAGYGEAARKVRVCHLGIDPDLFHPAEEDAARETEAFRKRYGLDKDFLLAVGNLRPHKNLGVVLDALAELQRRGAPLPQTAFIGAGDGEALRASASREIPADRIRVLGYLPDADVQSAYRAAGAVIFPSLYEGFGFPVLEAMSSGAPLIHSGRASLGEIAGDAGLDFDPFDPSSLADALIRLEREPGLREQLIERGLDRARQFRWEDCARAVWEAICEAAKPASSAQRAADG